MWEDRGGGGHGVSPLTPALSHQGRGGTSSYFLRNSNGQNSNPPHPSPLPPGERDRVRGTTLTTLTLHRAIRTKKVHGHSIAP